MNTTARSITGHKKVEVTLTLAEVRSLIHALEMLDTIPMAAAQGWAKHVTARREARAS